MQRLVTQQDLDKNPELKLKGVSVNQHYDFPDEDVNFFTIKGRGDGETTMAIGIDPYTKKNTPKGIQFVVVKPPNKTAKKK